MKKCAVCGSVAQDGDESCGVCGNRLLDVRPEEAAVQSATVQPSQPPKKLKLRAIALLFPPLALTSGIVIMLSWGSMFTVGISLIVIGFLSLLGVVGIGPTRRMQGYGWYNRRLERDLEDKQVEDESD